MPNLAYYYKSKWTRDDLNEKSVEFVFRDWKGDKSGIGTFRVHLHGDLISVVICEPHPD